MADPTYVGMAVDEWDEAADGDWLDASNSSSHGLAGSALG
jgi:hypothetical protein